MLSHSLQNGEEYTIGRISFAVLFVVAGSFHLIVPSIYLKIMPPYLPWHLQLVYASGAAEIFGGVGLLVPKTRRVAAWGLVTLLIAIMPANIYMATAHVAAPGLMGQSWAQWLRLPLQLPLMWWAWLYTRRSHA